MDRSPPPFFKQGPSANARLAFFTLLGLALLMIDARTGLLSAMRQGVGTVLYPLQRVALAPAALLDTALMLMRETASELAFSPEAVARERGVVLAEMRDRNSWQLRNLEDQFAFLNPGAHYTRRLPIGTAETLGGATADSL